MTSSEILGFRQSDNEKKEDRLEWRRRFADAKTIVVGGGGLLNIDFFEPALLKISELRTKGQKLALWGAGHNAWTIGDWRLLKQRVDLEKYGFDLIGIRDHNQPYSWVPCVSCMHPIFDGNRKDPQHEVGMYAHAGSLNNPNFKKQLPSNLPLLSNSASFEEAVDFIQSCKLVLTDSYHGLYWATLLGRKVIGFPSSSKFYDCKFPAPLCDPQDWRRYERMALTYPEALDECREANKNFAQRVADL
ncbi:polysaccharide pyruvyl transferase family protein [Roseomonas sp. WA12]